MSELSLSSRLKKLLTDANISEAELARRTGIAQPMVNRLATGKNKNPKLETLKPIAKYFSVTFSQLLGEEELPEAELKYSDNNKESINTKLFQLPLIEWDHIDLNNLTSERSVATTAKVNEKSFAVLLKDDTLAPRFPRNTVLTIDCELEVQNNDFIIVKNTANQTTSLMQVKLDSNQTKWLEDLGNKTTENNTVKQQYDQNQHQIIGVLVQTLYDHKQ